MKFWYSFTVLLLLSAQTLAQHTNVMISDKRNPNEVSICINPKNTQQLVAGANLREVYTSTNGGQTWQTDTLVCPAYGVWGDPVNVCDTAGAFYFLHLSNPPAGGSWIDRIVVQKMDSMGKPWSSGTYTGLNGSHNQDKHWMAVDPTTNNLYVTWTEFDKYFGAAPTDSSRILFSRSVNGGQTWSPAKRINQYCGKSADSDSATEGAVPCVGPNGEVYVAWSFAEKIYFDRSTDMGNTWLNQDKVISTQPGGWDYNIAGLQRANGMPVVACDLSQSPHRGTIYVNWTDQRNGANDVDVWLSKSTDGGNTWSAPKRVNSDGPGRQQFLTWMCIDQSNGNIYIVFYDRRNYPDDRTDVYMAYSKDGGNTFVDFKISETAFTPNANLFFGDYTNITAHNNVIRPIWTRMDYPKTSAWTALIDEVALGTDNKPAIPFEADQLYPNPSKGDLYYAFRLKQEDRITARLFDSRGSDMGLLLNNETRAAGKYVEHFKAGDWKLQPGIYVIHITTASGRVMNHRFVLTKND